MERLNKYTSSKRTQEREFSLYWLTAFGIQSVVDLKPSEVLLPLVEQHVRGEKSLNEIKQELYDYYHELHIKHNSHHIHRDEEADKVSIRILDYFLNGHFDLTIKAFCDAHYHLFHGIYHNSGNLRSNPASKKEWVLGNTTVLYPKPESIKPRLDYVLSLERSIDYSKMSSAHTLRHLSHFISDMFMVYAFPFANSRAVFVYTLKYLLSMGYHLQNDTFAKEAWYFRNAIIRASYANMHQGIFPTTQYMLMFLGNLLLNEENELRNHRMVIRGE